MFAEHYNPYPVEQPAINTETPNGEILAQGIRNYNRGNYIQVIAALTELEKQENPAILPPESTFTLGLDYLAVQDYPNAIKTFREHLDNKKEYQDQVRWYLGLAYLREDNPAEARQVLSGLTATDNEYTKKATRLNKKIEKMMD